MFVYSILDVKQCTKSLKNKYKNVKMPSDIQTISKEAFRPVYKITKVLPSQCLLNVRYLQYTLLPNLLQMAILFHSLTNFLIVIWHQKKKLYKTKHLLLSHLLQMCWQLRKEEIRSCQKIPAWLHQQSLPRIQKKIKIKLVS